MSDVFGQINFFGTPEAIHLFLIHIPYRGILYGKKNKPVLVFFKQRFDNGGFGGGGGRSDGGCGGGGV